MCIAALPERHCPAAARPRKTGLRLRRYRTGDCGKCVMKTHCTPGEARRITRWTQEHPIEAARARLISPSEPMTVRRSTVEPPFGTIKAWMGMTHFLTRRLRNVKTEITLNVLACNIRRMVALIGIRGLMAAMRA